MRSTQRRQGIGVLALLALVVSAFFGSLAVATSAPIAERTTAAQTRWSPLLLEATVDSFDESAQTIAASESSVMGADILGGERDSVLGAGLLRVEWDGEDGTATTTQYEGLGGVDLAHGNLQTLFALENLATRAPATLRLTVWSDERNWSRAEVVLAQALATPTRVEIPFARFTVGGGRGADFANVGALALEVEGATADLQLGGLTVGSTLTMVKGERLVRDANGNGVADRGDLLAYDLVLANGGQEAATGLHVSQYLLGRQTALLSGSVATTHGRVAQGNSAGDRVVGVEVGTLAAGEEAHVTYQASFVGNIVSATLIAQQGQAPAGGGGNLITSLNAPFTNDEGEVGFTGVLNNGGSNDTFVWFDNGIVWRNSSAPTTLTGGEATMGVGNNGEFIYSPLRPGGDTLWTHQGLLLGEDDPLPGSPYFATFLSRPTMLPDSTTVWVAGYATTTPDGATVGRMHYRATLTPTLQFERGIMTGDVISGYPIGTTGVGFDYQVSDKGTMHVNELILNTGSTTNDGAVYFDGVLVAQEGRPTGQGDNWSGFAAESVNDSAHYLFGGDTNGATSSDNFLAYRSAIALREGSTVGGVTLLSPASVTAVSVNDLDQAAYIWSVGGGTEVLFAACEVSNLSDAKVLLATGDSVDLNGDGTGDATVIDFNASVAVSPGLWLPETRSIFVEVDLGTLETILELVSPCEPQTASIILTKTVGTVPGVCAPTNVATLPSGGGSVTYCYQVEATGNMTLPLHDLEDSELGTLLNGEPLALGAGQLFSVTRTVPITQNTVNTATWVAREPGRVLLDPVGDILPPPLVPTGWPKGALVAAGAQGGWLHDITRLTAGSDLLSSLVVQLEFDSTISPFGSGEPDELVGFIQLDADQDKRTGSAGVGDTFCLQPQELGYEYSIGLDQYDAATRTSVMQDSNGAFVAAVPTYFTSTSVRVVVPLAAIGGDDGLVNLAPVMGNVSRPTDCAPNGRYLSSAAMALASASSSATVLIAPTAVQVGGLRSQQATPLAQYGLLALAGTLAAGLLGRAVRRRAR